MKKKVFEVVNVKFENQPAKDILDFCKAELFGKFDSVILNSEWNPKKLRAFTKVFKGFEKVVSFTVRCKSQDPFYKENGRIITKAGFSKRLDLEEMGL